MLGRVGGILSSSTLKAPPYNLSLSKYTDRHQAWRLNRNEQYWRETAHTATKSRSKRTKRWEKIMLEVSALMPPNNSPTVAKFSPRAEDKRGDKRGADCSPLQPRKLLCQDDTSYTNNNATTARPASGQTESDSRLWRADCVTPPRGARESDRGRTRKEVQSGCAR